MRFPSPFPSPFPSLSLLLADECMVASRYNDDLSLEDAIHTALLTLKEGFEGVMTEKTIQLGIISTADFGEEQLGGGHGTGAKGTPGFRKLTEAEVAE